MAEKYISVESVSELISNACIECKDACEESDGIYADCNQCLLHDVKKKLSTISAADVRPVVMGKWRFERGDGKTCVDGWVCSACNCGFHTKVPYFEGFNFCPNCGADMRAANDRPYGERAADDRPYGDGGE